MGSACSSNSIVDWFDVGNQYSFLYVPTVGIFVCCDISAGLITPTDLYATYYIGLILWHAFCDISNPRSSVSHYALWFANRLYTGGNVTILWGHGTGHSKQKLVYVHVSYSERFLSNNYFTVNKFGFTAQNCSSLTPNCALLNFCLWVWMKSEVNKTKVDTRDKLCDQIMDDIDSIKKLWCTQTSATPCPCTIRKVHGCWRWNSG